MTSESMTDVERVRANIVAVREELMEKLNLPRRIRNAVERARDSVPPRRRKIIAASAVSAVAALVCLAVSYAAVRSRRRQ